MSIHTSGQVRSSIKGLFTESRTSIHTYIVHADTPQSILFYFTRGLTKRYLLLSGQVKHLFVTETSDMRTWNMFISCCLCTMRGWHEMGKPLCID